ncbi:MAG TPA: DUF6134 family protein, partial [Acetobacteraceae bacterium]|nr:DUF6134 family protein [Acetobacteraceae bacterium]
ALAARGALAAAPADIAFRVVREGAPVGTHTVRFREGANGLLEARSEVRILVRLAGFTVYRYTHDTEEAWRGDRLVALTSRLDRNGRAGFAEARAEGGAILLRGSAGETRLPAEAAPLTWWRAASFAGGPLFDPRDGGAVRPRIERLPAPAGLRRLLVQAADTAEVVHDSGGRWVGFSTRGEDGSTATYERG